MPLISSGNPPLLLLKVSAWAPWKSPVLISAPAACEGLSRWLAPQPGEDCCRSQLSGISSLCKPRHSQRQPGSSNGRPITSRPQLPPQSVKQEMGACPSTVQATFAQGIQPLQTLSISRIVTHYLSFASLNLACLRL